MGVADAAYVGLDIRSRPLRKWEGWMMPPVSIPDLPAVFRRGYVEPYEPHPIANLLPKMETSQLMVLSVSIKANGLLDEAIGAL
jgi:hypothetical protein